MLTRRSLRGEWNHKMSLFLFVLEHVCIVVKIKGFHSVARLVNYM